MLNPLTGQWEEAEIGKLSNKRYGSLAVTLASHGTYMLGGPGFDKKSELLAPGSTTWMEGPTLPIQAYGGCAVPISEDSFILIYAESVREFDASIAGPKSSDSWTEEAGWPKLQTERYSMACEKVGNKIIVAGGSYGTSTYGQLGTYFKSTEVIDIGSRSISFGGDLAEARRGGQIVTSNGHVFFIGGLYRTINEEEEGKFNYVVLNSVEEWDPSTETWQQVSTPIHAKRSKFSAIAAPMNLVCPPL